MLIIAVFSGLLQAVGYLLYLRYAFRRETRPNAASSLMFAYGTALLVFLEWRSGAPVTILLLPTTCAVLGIAVGVYCLQRRIWQGIDRFELVAFACDLAFTAGYFLAATIGNANSIAPLFLVLTNLSALTSFLPLLRSTYREPQRERTSPWVVWTVAYGVLLVLTLAQGGAPIFLLYPASNLVLHALVAGLSLRRSRMPSVPAS